VRECLVLLRCVTTFAMTRKGIPDERA
jgi:hypothetical protein